MKLHDELDIGGKWELVFHRLQIAEEDLASEIFPKTMGRRIVQAEEIRHSSDYDPFYIASKGGTQKQIETAKDFWIMPEDSLWNGEKQKDYKMIIHCRYSFFVQKCKDKSWNARDQYFYFPVTGNDGLGIGCEGERCITPDRFPVKEV